MIRLRLLTILADRLDQIDVGVVFCIAVGGVALLDTNRPPKPPSLDIHEGRTEKIVWVNEGDGVAAIADTPFKIRKCPDNKFVVEYNGQALSGGHHYDRFGSPDDREAASDGRADSAQAAAKWSYVVRYHFHFYPPHRRVIPVGGEAHTLPVCQQVNDSEDFPADFFDKRLPPTIWQAEGGGVWKLVSNPLIRIHQCKKKNWRGEEFALEYDGQTQSWALLRWYAEDAGETLSQKTPAIDPIFKAPEFAPPRSNLPVCEQKAT